MSEATDEPKPRRGGNPNMVKGAPSVNPKGRPRSGMAFADAIRRRIDPDRILDLLDRLLDDETVPIVQRLAAALPYAHAGFLKPPTTTAAQLHVTGAIATGADGDRPFAELDADALRSRLAAARAAALRIALPSSIPDEEHSP